MKKLIAYISAVLLIVSVLMCAPGAMAASAKRIAIVSEGEILDFSPQIGRIPDNQLTWTVTDSNVIGAQGKKITAKKMGLSIAGVTYRGSTVWMGIVVLPSQITVKVGESYQLPYGTVEQYGSQNKGIAVVSGKGVIYGLNVGTTKIGVKYGSQIRVVDVLVEANNRTIPAEQQSKAAQLDCAATAEQIVLVEYQGKSNALLSIHEKKNGVWTELASCNAYVGKNGIGKVKEGDKKTPVGTYNLTIPFGIKDDPGSKLPYTKVTKYHYWCGKSSSPYYNQLVDMRLTGTSVTSSDEYLINYKGVYNYCMFIDYNAAGIAGKGSCIFLHCKGSNNYTAGCIAVDENFMKNIIRWADHGCKIVIR